MCPRPPSWGPSNSPCGWRIIARWAAIWAPCARWRRSRRNRRPVGTAPRPGGGSLRADMGAQRALLAGGRLHLNHGPIDLIIEAFGAAEEVDRAYEQAWACFPDILPGLTAELR